MHIGGWADTRDTVKAGQGYIARGECSCNCNGMHISTPNVGACPLPPPSPFITNHVHVVGEAR